VAYPVCVDASILLKWTVPEDDSAQALDLLNHFIETGATIVEPLLCLYEVPSAIRRKVTKHQISEDEAAEALGKWSFLTAQLNISTEERRRIQRAWDIASSHGLGRIYDCIYLALAEELGADCWTADARFHSAVSAEFPRLRLLSSFEP
jgi:predicted nucleic acid-binding protein